MPLVQMAFVFLSLSLSLLTLPHVSFFICTISSLVCNCSTVSDYSWKNVAAAYLQETMDRNVLWTIRRCGLKYATSVPDPHIDQDRIEKTFVANHISWRLLVFQVKFLEIVAKPAGASLEEVAKEYDRLYGRPSARVRDALQAATKDIQENVINFDEFFKRIGLPTLSREELLNLLRRSVSNSERKGYHCPNSLSPPSRSPSRSPSPSPARSPSRGKSPTRGGGTPLRGGYSPGSAWSSPQKGRGGRDWRGGGENRGGGGGRARGRGGGGGGGPGSRSGRV